MSDRGPAVTAASATRDVAVPPPSLAVPRPFARPTPSDGGRPTPPARPSPFVALTEPDRRPSQADAGAGAGRAAAIEDGHQHPSGDDPDPDARVGSTPMAWPAAAELDAADALDALARRLRVGTLRLPIVVDSTCPSAVLAAVLAAIHAESSRATTGRSTGRPA